MQKTSDREKDDEVRVASNETDVVSTGQLDDTLYPGLTAVLGPTLDSTNS